MPIALIVEDEPQANHLLSMLVQLRGYSTESAFSGREALEKVRAHLPDVVFLDLMLPDVDGYEICRTLKSSGSTSQVPVVIVTARVADENRIESFLAGADDYVPKPYTPDQIFEALDQSDLLRQENAAATIEDAFVLGRHDQGDALRRLARLRGLLLARSGLGREAIERMSKTLRSIWSSVDQWGQRSGVERVATLTYVLSPERLLLTVRDPGGWLPRAGTPGHALEWTPAGDTGFDRIETDHENQSLRLTKRFDGE
jgi:CheY-like chemotaxis protein